MRDSGSALTTFILPLVVGLIACRFPRFEHECGADSNCDLEPGGACLVAPSGRQWCTYPDSQCPSGMRYSDFDTGDGLSNVCVEASVDAGVDADVDAPVLGPIVTNYQLADLVIGQANYTSAVDRGFTAQSISGSAVAANASGVWIADLGRARVSGFSPIPVLSDPTATRVVGRPALNDSAPIGAVSASNLGTTLRAVYSTNDVLMVADVDRHRVLIWKPLPTTLGESADLVLGQPNMAASGIGRGAGQMVGPSGVWTDGVRVVVADTFNHRALIWNTFPAVNGQPADVVLGQRGFDLDEVSFDATASNLHTPWAVLFDGRRLYIADEFFNRVLVWDGLPTVNNEPADFVLGQLSLTDEAVATASATTLSNPTGLARYGDALLVADKGNDRVLVFQPLPTSSGSAASRVLGQPTLDTQPLGGLNPPTQQAFDGPSGLAVVGTQLYVADGNNRRVLRFTLRN